MRADLAIGIEGGIDTGVLASQINRRGIRCNVAVLTAAVTGRESWEEIEKLLDELEKRI